MFAQIYPVCRLPRRFVFFDYVIPDKLAIEIGDLVQIEFRGRAIAGVVRAIAPESEVEKVSPIIGVIMKSAMTESDLERFELISQAIGQSPSSLLNATYQDWRGRSSSFKAQPQSQKPISINQSRAEELRQALRDLAQTDRLYFATDFDGELALAHLLRRKFPAQMLIVVPRERQMRLLVEAIKLGDHVAVLHGHTSPTEREAIINAWRRGEITTLIGSRQAALLPAQNLSIIQVLDASSHDHQAYDRNPRLDLRLLAELQAHQHQAKLVSSGPVPTVRDFARKVMILTCQTQPSQIINLKAQEEWTGQPFISETLIQAITKSLQQSQKVLCSFNRTGVAKMLRCRDCGHIPVCGTCGHVPQVRLRDLICAVCHTEMWLPEKCPACQSSKLSKRGLGNKSIKHQLQQIWPQARIGVVDKKTQDLSAEIIVATEYYFKNLLQPFERGGYGLIAELNADQNLVSHDYQSMEQAAYKLHRLERLAYQEGAACLIQTGLPKITKQLLDWHTFLKNETRLRQQYNLPPSTTMFDIKSMTEDNAIEQLKSQLPSTIKINQTSPQQWQFTASNDDLALVQQLLRQLPDQYKIICQSPNYDQTSHCHQSNSLAA